MATIENLPQELIDNCVVEESLNEIDILNCSVALAGTIHEKFVTQKFLKPQLKIFASLDFNLKESLKNEGWFEECEDTKLIMQLCKKFKPCLPSMYLLCNFYFIKIML